MRNSLKEDQVNRVLIQITVLQVITFGSYWNSDLVLFIRVGATAQQRSTRIVVEGFNHELCLKLNTNVEPYHVGNQLEGNAVTKHSFYGNPSPPHYLS